MSSAFTVLFFHLFIFISRQHSFKSVIPPSDLNCWCCDIFWLVAVELGDFPKSVNPDTLITSDGQIPVCTTRETAAPRPPIGVKRLQVNLARPCDRERKRKEIDSFLLVQSCREARNLLSPSVAASHCWVGLKLQHHDAAQSSVSPALNSPRPERRVGRANTHTIMVSGEWRGGGIYSMQCPQLATTASRK